MTDPRQFGANKPAGAAAAKNAPSGPLDCSAVELLLPEWAEQTLTPGVAEQLRVHATACEGCREKLTQARKGREWLLVLKQEALEPPAGLVAKILAQTSVAGVAGAASGAERFRGASDRFRPETQNDQQAYPEGNRDRVPTGRMARGEKNRSSRDVAVIPGKDSDARSIPAWQHSSVVVLRRTFIEPRLALVAAMAFFSVALTLNLLGVRLTSLNASDLRPRNMHRAITRQYAEANARVVRYYENLRIVYEVEARVQQLRRAAETSTPPEEHAKPRKQSSDSTGDSSNGARGSHRAPLTDNPLARDNKRSAPSALPDPKPMVAGPRMDAADRQPHQFPLAEEAGEHTLATSFVQLLVFHPTLPASSCSLPNFRSSMRYFSTRERRLA